LLWKASDERLLPERVYIAPHAPSFVLADMRNEEQLRKLNAEFREIWNGTRATVELARGMFEGFPGLRDVGTSRTHRRCRRKNDHQRDAAAALTG